MTYKDPNIQKAINDNFTAQQSVIRNQGLATAQAVENQRLVSLSQAQATATVIAGNAAAQVLAARGQELDSHPGLVNYELAQRSQGNVPGMLVLGSGSTSTLPFGFFLQPPMTPSTSQSITATVTLTPTPSGSK